MPQLILPKNYQYPLYVIFRDDTQTVVEGYKSTVAGALTATAQQLTDETGALHEVVDINHRHNTALRGPA